MKYALESEDRAEGVESGPSYNGFLALEEHQQGPLGALHRFLVVVGITIELWAHQNWGGGGL